MTSRKLAQPFPLVTPETDAMDAARKLAAEGLPGPIGCHDDGRPYTIFPGSEVLRFLIPSYVQDDPALARTPDEAASDALCRTLMHSTVARVGLPSERACRTRSGLSWKGAWPARHKEGMPR